VTKLKHITLTEKLTFLEFFEYDNVSAQALADKFNITT